MERRKFLIGMGSVAAGGAAAVGTGAFTSVQANRAISVDVAGDGNSYLGLHPNPNDDSVSTASGTGTLSIDLASDSGYGGTGVPNDGVTRIWPAFTLRNQGPETIYVEIDNPLADSDLSDGGVDVQFLAVDNADNNLLGGNTAVLFDRTSVVQSVGSWEVGNPSAIAQNEGSSTPRGYKGGTKGGQRFKGNNTVSAMHLGLTPGQDVDVIVRVFAMVDDVSVVNLSDDITIEAYTDQSNTTIQDGEDWLGD